jgi:hypothetical protein
MQQQTPALLTAEGVHAAVAAYYTAIRVEGAERVTPAILAAIDAMRDQVRHVRELPGMMDDPDAIEAGHFIGRARRALGKNRRGPESHSTTYLDRASRALILAIRRAIPMSTLDARREEVCSWMHHAAGILSTSPALASELRRTLGLPGDDRIRALLGLPAEDEGEDEAAPLDAPARPLGRAVADMPDDDDVIDDGDGEREFYRGVQWSAAHLAHLTAKPGGSYRIVVPWPSARQISDQLRLPDHAPAPSDNLFADAISDMDRAKAERMGWVRMTFAGPQWAAGPSEHVGDAIDPNSAPWTSNLKPAVAFVSPPLSEMWKKAMVRKDAAAAAAAAANARASANASTPAEGDDAAAAPVTPETSATSAGPAIGTAHSKGRA